MELRDLRTFAAVARLLSFHRAAAELNAAQSTVSARIAALETELGVRLFERLGRRVALTEAGERLVQYAAKLIDVEDEARAWVTGESRLRGMLTVRVPESLCAYRLPPVIAAFRRRHPEVALHLTACTLNGLEKDLRQGITDLAFVMADSVRGGDLNVEALGVEPLLLVAAPHHPLATRGRVTARDLHGVTLALSTADCAYRAAFEEALATEGVQPAAGLEFSSAAALRGCVASGTGITLLPEAAVRDDLRAGTLRALAWAEQPFETAVLMVRHRGKWVPPYMDTFMALCRAACAQGTGDGAAWDAPFPPEPVPAGDVDASAAPDAPGHGATGLDAAKDAEAAPATGGGKAASEDPGDASPAPGDGDGPAPDFAVDPSGTGPDMDMAAFDEPFMEPDADPAGMDTAPSPEQAPSAPPQAAPLPEPAPEAPQWLSLLPPKR
ncbi:LysR family transcriptional regulator [Nitratidesulfovibrio sp. 1201_IL3209]|uniref:LysR family transcriptional regulator n=1 Tax=Nitratidesulfovibrio sp. 1201_IL3209 TaxID=3084053 RepID=UPI002FD930D0